MFITKVWKASNRLVNTSQSGNDCSVVHKPQEDVECADTSSNLKSTWNSHTKPSRLFMYTHRENSPFASSAHGTRVKAFKMIYCKWFSTLFAKIINSTLGLRF